MNHRERLVYGFGIYIDLGGIHLSDTMLLQAPLWASKLEQAVTGERGDVLSSPSYTFVWLLPGNTYTYASDQRQMTYEGSENRKHTHPKC